MDSEQKAQHNDFLFATVRASLQIVELLSAPQTKEF